MHFGVGTGRGGGIWARVNFMGERMLVGSVAYISVLQMPQLSNNLSLDGETGATRQVL